MIDDASWFRRYPKRSYRLRLPDPVHDEEAGAACVAVGQIAPGVRIRQPCKLVTTVGEPFELPQSEAAAAAIFAGAACYLARRVNGKLVLTPELAG